LTDWFLAIEGTEIGRQFAFFLALMAGVLHAAFGAMQKGSVDPWIMRGAIDISYGLMALPVVFYIVPWPETHQFVILAGVWFIHTAYKILQAMAYTRGAYTVVYPIVRGSAPLFTVIGAYFLFGEIFGLGEWFGLLILLSGIFGLAIYNLVTNEVDRKTLNMALGLAFCTGLFVALYTTYDAYGIRNSADPFTFVAWLFLIDSFAMPIVAFVYAQKNKILLRGNGLFWRGPIGGVLAVTSFGSILLATRLDKVGEAAILRETSVIFAALMGWLFLKEKVGAYRLILMSLIVLGAVLVEFLE